MLLISDRSLPAKCLDGDLHSSVASSQARSYMPALVTYKGRLLTFFDRTSENDGASVPVVHAAAVSVPSGDYVRVCSVLDAASGEHTFFFWSRKTKEPSNSISVQ